jgi:hypothetical protein
MYLATTTACFIENWGALMRVRSRETQNILGLRLDHGSIIRTVAPEEDAISGNPELAAMVPCHYSMQDDPEEKLPEGITGDFEEDAMLLIGMLAPEQTGLKSQKDPQGKWLALLDADDNRKGRPAGVPYHDLSHREAHETSNANQQGESGERFLELTPSRSPRQHQASKATLPTQS